MYTFVDVFTPPLYQHVHGKFRTSAGRGYRPPRGTDYICSSSPSSPWFLGTLCTCPSTARRPLPCYVAPALIGRHSATCSHPECKSASDDARAEQDLITEASISYNGTGPGLLYRS